MDRPSDPTPILELAQLARTEPPREQESWRRFVARVSRRLLRESGGMGARVLRAVDLAEQLDMDWRTARDGAPGERSFLDGQAALARAGFERLYVEEPRLRWSWRGVRYGARKRSEFWGKLDDGVLVRIDMDAGSRTKDEVRLDGGQIALELRAVDPERQMPMGMGGSTPLFRDYERDANGGIRPDYDTFVGRSYRVRFGVADVGLGEMRSDDNVRFAQTWHHQHGYADSILIDYDCVAPLFEGFHERQRVLDSDRALSLLLARREMDEGLIQAGRRALCLPPAAQRVLAGVERVRDGVEAYRQAYRMGLVWDVGVPHPDPENAWTAEWTVERSGRRTRG